MADVSEAISAATAAATKEYESAEGSPAATEPVESTPAVEPKPDVKAETKAELESVKGEPPKGEDNPLDLTAEDLESIQSDPLLRKAYKTVLRGFNAKTSDLAKQRKEHEESLKTIDWFRSDPDNAIRTLARMRGIKVDTPTETEQTVDEIEEVMVKTLGPEGAKALRPVFETIVDKLLEKKIAPQQAELQQMKEAAVEVGVDNTVQTFIAELHADDQPYDEEIQNEMAELAMKVRKGDETPLKDYLGMLYNSVMRVREQKAQVSTELKRLRDARKKTEPVTGTRPAAAPTRAIRSDMSLNEKVRMAVEMAQDENR